MFATRATMKLSCILFMMLAIGWVGSEESAEGDAPQTAEEQLQEKLETRENMLRQMAAALQGIGSKGEGEGFEVIKKMADSCYEALAKAEQVEDPLKKLGIIEKQLSHREEWVTALSAVQGKKVQEQKEDDFKRDVAGEL